MNLDNLKPAWRQVRLSDSLHAVNQQEILAIIESAEAMTISKTNRLLTHSIMFAILILFCQGG
jgi:hypothetical protein